MMNNKIMIIVGVVILIVLAGALLVMGTQNNQPATQDSMETTEESMMEDESMDAMDSTDSGSMDSMEKMDGEDAMMEGVKTFTIENEGLSFTPNEITVNEGDTVRITFVNTFGTHDLVIDEFDVRTPIINAGEEETIEFVADEAGTYEFYCSVPGHRAAGMWGTLTVE